MEAISCESTDHRLDTRVKELTRTGSGSIIHNHLIEFGRGTPKVKVSILASERETYQGRNLKPWLNI